MVIQSVALIGYGVINNYALIASLLKNYDQIIAVDGGLIHCKAMNITPDLIIGDLDSAYSDVLDLFPQVPKKIYPRDKDFTDMELAIQAVDLEKIKKIGMFGSMEGRVDHSLVNLHLICRMPKKKIVIETDHETIFLIYEKKEFNCYPGQIISLISFGTPAVGVTTKGLKWELNCATLDKNFFSLSNVCLYDSFEVSVEQGDLLCLLIR